MHRITVVAVALALTLPAAAAEKFDPDARARAVAPYLDAQTVGVVHIDLTRVDAGAVVAAVAEPAHLDAESQEEWRRDLRGWLADVTRAGGKDLYAVLSMADLPMAPPFVVVPLSAGADGKAVAREMGRSQFLQQLRFEALDQVVIGAGPDTLRRLRTLQPVPRPEVARAFAAAGDTAAQALLLPSPDDRRVIEELLPTLPPAVGGGPTAPLTHGLEWAALGVDLPPKPAVRLVIQSPDPAAATALADALARVRQALAPKDGRGAGPELDLLTALLNPKVEGDRLTAAPGGKELLAVLSGAARSAYQAATRSQSMNDLKQLVLSLHSYADANKRRLPAVASFDKQGKPLLSWRVHVLPYLGESALYKQFHLDEPWDSPHNKPLLARMPRVFQGPNRKLNREGKTIYLLPVGKDVAFKEGPEGPRMPADFPDGTSNTILMVEADDAHAAPWTKPEDLAVDLDHPERGLGGHFPGGFLVGLADGSVRLVAGSVSKATLRAAFTPAGGEVLGPDW